MIEASRRETDERSKLRIEAAIRHLADAEDITVSDIKWGEPPIEHPTRGTVTQMSEKAVKIWTSGKWVILYPFEEEFDDYSEDDRGFSVTVDRQMRAFLIGNFKSPGR